METERCRIGKRIGELRRQSNMSQAELANKIGIRENTIARLEKGKFNPGFDILQKIAEVFNMKIDFMD